MTRGKCDRIIVNEKCTSARRDTRHATSLLLLRRRNNTLQQNQPHHSSLVSELWNQSRRNELHAELYGVVNMTAHHAISLLSIIKWLCTFYRTVCLSRKMIQSHYFFSATSQFSIFATFLPFSWDTIQSNTFIHHSLIFHSQSWSFLCFFFRQRWRFSCPSQVTVWPWWRKKRRTSRLSARIASWDSIFRTVTPFPHVEGMKEHIKFATTAWQSTRSRGHYAG